MSELLLLYSCCHLNDSQLKNLDRIKAKVRSQVQGQGTPLTRSRKMWRLSETEHGIKESQMLFLSKEQEPGQDRRAHSQMEPGKQTWKEQRMIRRMCKPFNSVDDILSEKAQEWNRHGLLYSNNHLEKKQLYLRVSKKRR